MPSTVNTPNTGDQVSPRILCVRLADRIKIGTTSIDLVGED